MIKEREVLEEDRVGKHYRVVREGIKDTGRCGQYICTNDYGWIYLRFLDSDGVEFFYPTELEEVLLEVK